jgi:hypothetical protein
MLCPIELLGLGKGILIERYLSVKLPRARSGFCHFPSLVSYQAEHQEKMRNRVSGSSNETVQGISNSAATLSRRQ